MAISDKINPVIEYKRKLDELEQRIIALETALSSVETKLSAGITTSAYFVCNNDATYNATNSKTLTVTNGIITNVET